MKSVLIKDTTKEEREAIIRQSLDCGGGCENCSSCWLGGGNLFEMYQRYIDGEMEIREINPPTSSAILMALDAPRAADRGEERFPYPIYANVMNIPQSVDYSEGTF
ncbi:MAG: hypothetical protein LUG99_17640 [Lachnospiraceae bacterium]|nr:hypothetical protein [Lachnospiraceae bacterium]